MYNLLFAAVLFMFPMYCMSQGNLVQPWFPKAPPLDAPFSKIVTVTTTDEFIHAVEKASAGMKIVLEDGIYYLPKYVEINTDHVMICSLSGNRDKVILDGSQSIHGELIGFRNCNGVTVAGITIQNIKWNGFKINADDNVQNLTIYNCVIHNIWERGVKSVRVPNENREAVRPKNVRIQHCLFYNDRAKQFSDDTKDTPETFNGNYVGGIDAMHPKQWVISDNVFINIQGRTREGRACVFLWHHAEDCLIERNIIIDCDVGIALGNSSGIGPNESSVHGTNMIVRNNFIVRTPESGIVTDYTKDCQIVNNTIYDPDNRMSRLIRIVHDNAALLVVNNLLSGSGMSVETEDSIVIENNPVGDFEEYFIDAKSGNLHLNQNAHVAVNKGKTLNAVKNDIDGDARDALTDTGADEFVMKEE